MMKSLNFLLDTHAFLWFVLDDPRLSPAAAAANLDRRNNIYVSPASHWEIAIKISPGRYRLQADFECDASFRRAMGHLQCPAFRYAGSDTAFRLWGW
jgi:PIN domain nuclease of toxin-antitoxin system